MKPTTVTFSFLFALVTSLSNSVAFAQVIWSDDVSDCSSWTFGNGSGELNQPWTDVDLNFECSTVGPAGFFNGWAGGNSDGTPAPGINSTTGGNGFLLLDSDEYGGEEAYDVFWVENSWAQTTEPINLEGHPQVKIVFETRYRCWDNGANDGSEKCFVEFSRDGVTWPTLSSSYVTDWVSQGLVSYDGELVQCRYEVFPELQTGFSTEDPSLIELNVSETVGDQAEVWVRFRWVGTWGYSWEIDDIAINDIPPNDLRIGDDVSPTNYAETGYFENGTWALSQIPQDLAAGIQAYNAGTESQNNVQVSLDVNGTTTTSMVGALSPDDSIAVSIPYTIEDVGEYTLNYTVSSDTEDAEPMNNSTSQSFTVTEHIYGRDNGTIESAWPSANDPFVDYVAMPLYNIHNDVVIYGIDVALMDVGDLNEDFGFGRALLYDIGTTGNFPATAQYDGVVLLSDEVELPETFTNNLGDEDVTWVTLLFEEPYVATAGQLLGAAFESFGGYASQVAEAQEVPSGTAWYYGPFGASSTYDWYWSNNVPMVRLNLDPDAVTSGVLASGCTNPISPNYDPLATVDDGSCEACSNVPSDSSIFHPFISEYCEGTGNNKAIEIFNPNPFALELDGYVLQRYANGSTSVSDEMQLEGVMSPLGTWVVVNGQTEDVPLAGGSISPAVDPDLLSLADQLASNQYPSPLYFNGNDALALIHSPSQTVVDLFGKVGEDPGFSWTNDAANGFVDVGNGAIGLTANNTLRRRSSVYQGVQQNPIAFNALLEWYPVDNNNWSGLGSHDYCWLQNYGCTDVLACNYDVEADVDDGSCLFPGDPCDEGDSPTGAGVYNLFCFCEAESNVVGCVNPNACNYNADATESDGSCYFPGDPCDDGDATTSNDMYNDSCGCEGDPNVVGCINPNACNYNPEAVESDGSCYFPGDPCDDGDATTSNDMYNDSCGCEGDPNVVGCINPNACNYNPEAEESDGSCLFPGDPCDDGDLAIEGLYTGECVCVGITTAVAEAEGAMRLYPNPAYGHVVVELGSAEVSTVLVFDQWGRQVKSTQVVGTARLDLGSLAAGTYQVVVQEGDAVLMRRPLVVLEGR